jgi:serine protease Do
MMQEQFHFSVYQSVSRARRVAFALLMAVILIAGGMQHVNVQAQAAGLPDFTTIVEKSEPAVVNIRTTAKVAARSGPQGQDPYEMFRQFFGPDFQPPGGRQGPQQNPRGKPRTEPDER